MWHRNRLVQMLVDKEDNDHLLMSSNRDDWYTVNLNYMDLEVSSTFHPSYFDHDTENFINVSTINSNNFCLQIYYSMISTFLSLIITKTSVNGLLNRGGMFIFSRNQFKNFIGLPDDWSIADKKILDIGAGDGGVTKILSEFYSHVSVVEASKIMEWRLSQRGYSILSLNKWKSSGPYNLISALNLLDRHYNPLEFLSDLHQLTTESNCLVLISLVLPFRPYVEYNPINKVSSVTVSGSNFEDHVNSLIQNTFQPAGFELIRWTKLPYLCEGDMTQAFYKLDDAVFLLRPIPRLIISTPFVNNKQDSNSFKIEIHNEF